MLKTYTHLLIAVLLGLVAAGCSSGPPYVPPNLPANQVATLKGDIGAIDGFIVKETNASLLGFSAGVQTTATPGRHKVVAANGSGHIHTHLDLAAGNVYLFDLSSFKLTLTNKTAGRTWIYDGYTLTLTDPAGKFLPTEQLIAP